MAKKTIELDSQLMRMPQMFTDAIKEITDGTFEQEILNNPEPTLVCFFSDWCCACKLSIPRFDAYAERYRDIRIRSINVETSPATSCRYQVVTLPTVILFQNGQPLYVHRGAVNRADLEKMFQMIPPPADELED